MPNQLTLPMLGFDIFCRIIDHFGDAGVCWRLANQLAVNGQGAPVRLWVDNLPTLARLVPAVHPLRPKQVINGISLHHWNEPEHAHLPWPKPYPVVIEAFAGGLPDGIRQQLSLQHLWVVLDHLSAEPWVNEVHGRANTPQPHPQRYFFYTPGFSPKTGGLLREKNLQQQINRWQQLPKARQWQQLQKPLGLSAAMLERLIQPNTRSYFIFQYPNAPVAALLRYLSQQPNPSVVLFAADQQPIQPIGQFVTSSSLMLAKLPFLEQPIFDQLLWSCDMNFVRGEDSWMRALWAQKPFIWHPYPQQQQVHQQKLQAWLQQIKLPYAAQQLQRRWVNASEQPQVQNILHATDFEALQPVVLAAWQRRVQAQAYRWYQHPPLAEQLIRFCTQQLPNNA